MRVILSEKVCKPRFRQGAGLDHARFRARLAGNLPAAAGAVNCGERVDLAASGKA